MKRRSEEITGRKNSEKWVERTAARTMLRAVRFTDEDFDKPIIALAVPHTNGTPCNDHVRALGEQGEQGEQGDAGPQGMTGAPGETGDTGKQGDPGAPGMPGPVPTSGKISDFVYD